MDISESVPALSNKFDDLPVGVWAGGLRRAGYYAQGCNQIEDFPNVREFNVIASSIVDGLQNKQATRLDGSDGLSEHASVVKVYEENQGVLAVAQREVGSQEIGLVPLEALVAGTEDVGVNATWADVVAVDAVCVVEEREQIATRATGYIGDGARDPMGYVGCVLQNE